MCVRVSLGSDDCCNDFGFFDLGFMMQKQEELILRHQAALIGNYGKLPVVFHRGQGSHLWDVNGKEYLDLFAGFGGTILGHCHPALVKAVTQQANTLWQVGNQFYTEPQIRLAEQLRSKAFAGQAFFCQSGAEAAEAAIKLARISAGPDRFKIISMHKSFHGRTMGALSATAGPAQQGFAPLVPGFTHVPFNDIAAVERAIDAQTAAVMVEPVQGEGGINMPNPGYLQALRALCDRTNVALIFDEVWVGLGRTGEYFGHQNFGVTPDIMTLGKALGGGLPVGAILARPERAAYFKPSTHGSTLGGNPICAAVAAAVLDELEKEQLPQRAKRLGAVAAAKLESFKNRAKIADIRGCGLFIGVELVAADALPVVQEALKHGLIINVTQKNVLRICPALTIEENDLLRGLEILDACLASI